MWVLPPLRSGSWIQGGATLVEVLVTILILAFGLLGLVTLQTKVQTAQSDSYQRAQALLLVHDMAGRISVNRSGAAEYVTTAPLGAGDGQPPSCTGLAGAAKDHCEWSHAIQGAAETQGGALVGAVVAGRGCVEQIGAGPPVYRISEAWQGLSDMSESALPCARGLYPRETLRRVVSDQVAVPDLGG